MKKHLFALMLVSPITFAGIDQIYPIYIKIYGWDMVAKQIKRNGYRRNDILQIFYGMDKPLKEMMLIASNGWCRFDRNIYIEQSSVQCLVLILEDVVDIFTTSKKPVDSIRGNSFNSAGLFCHPADPMTLTNFFALSTSK